MFKCKLLSIIREDVISTHGSPIVGVNVGEKVGVHVGVTVGCSDLLHNEERELETHATI